jgi:hypothetical protein
MQETVMIQKAAIMQMCLGCRRVHNAGGAMMLETARTQVGAMMQKAAMMQEAAMIHGRF